MPDAAVAPALTNQHLTAPVRLAIADPGAELGAWTMQSLAGGRGLAGSVYRVTGDAQIGHNVVPWSLILKIIMNPHREQEQGVNYWKREFLAYQTLLLFDLPRGIAAPRCFGAVEHPEEATWLWLEDVEDISASAWSVADYARTARHLGQFNGAYLVERELPLQMWLNRRLLRNWLAQYAKYVEQFPAALGDSAVQQFCSRLAAERLLRLWHDRGVLLDALEQLPQCFCHHDAFRRNLLTPAADRTVAIDWEFAGIGAVGEELSPLIGGSLAMFSAEAGTARQLDEAAFAEYMDGLHDAQWQGNPATVRFAFTASAALRFGLVWALWLAVKLSEGEDGRQTVERFFDRPVDAVIAHFAIVLPWFLERGDEARRLLQHRLGAVPD
jgi:Phosphotransferase enzyme family